MRLVLVLLSTGFAASAFAGEPPSSAVTGLPETVLQLCALDDGSAWLRGETGALVRLGPAGQLNRWSPPAAESWWAAQALSTDGATVWVAAGDELFCGVGLDLHRVEGARGSPHLAADGDGTAVQAEVGGRVVRWRCAADATPEVLFALAPEVRVRSLAASGDGHVWVNALGPAGEVLVHSAAGGLEVWWGPGQRSPSEPPRSCAGLLASGACRSEGTVGLNLYSEQSVVAAPGGAAWLSSTWDGTFSVTVDGAAQVQRPMAALGEAKLSPAQLRTHAPANDFKVSSLGWDSGAQCVVATAADQRGQWWLVSFGPGAEPDQRVPEVEATRQAGGSPPLLSASRAGRWVFSSSTFFFAPRGGQWTGFYAPEAAARSHDNGERHSEQTRRTLAAVGIGLGVTVGALAAEAALVAAPAHQPYSVALRDVVVGSAVVFAVSSFARFTDAVLSPTGQSSRAWLVVTAPVAAVLCALTTWAMHAGDAPRPGFGSPMLGAALGAGLSITLTLAAGERVGAAALGLIPFGASAGVAWSAPRP